MLTKCGILCLGALTLASSAWCQGPGGSPSKARAASLQTKAEKMAESKTVAPSSGLTRAEALAVYKRFQALAGDWQTSSTKGWEGNETQSVIARGSVVLNTSSFKDESSSRGMATAIHMDGDRLLITHYCEAGNQPRLVASSIADEGRTVTFTFLDGTNMASREVGHMDKVIFRFIDDDHFTSQWTWYQQGKETWFEEITNTRIGR